MMYQKRVDGMRIFGKRGSNKLPDLQLFTGWFVGFIETKNDIYFFTSYIESPNLQHPLLVEGQKEIVYNFLPSLNLK